MAVGEVLQLRRTTGRVVMHAVLLGLAVGLMAGCGDDDDGGARATPTLICPPWTPTPTRKR